MSSIMNIAQYRVEDNSYNVNYNQTETLQSIANKYNISVKDIAIANNCYNNIPVYVQDIPQIKNTISNIETIQALIDEENAKEEQYYSRSRVESLEKSKKELEDKMFIKIPLINSGGIDGEQSYGTNYFTKNYAINEDNLGQTTIYHPAQLVGPGGSVYLTINGQYFGIPCYPTSISDSLSVSHTSNTVAYRTEPYYNYSGSGPRVVSISLNLHREMAGAVGLLVDDLVKAVQSACYPKTGASNAIETVFCAGADVYIRGIITGSVSVTYSGPIIDAKYNVIDLSFSITEVKGDLITQGYKLGVGSYTTY